MHWLAALARADQRKSSDGRVEDAIALGVSGNLLSQFSMRH
ncbi:hypothetical protein L284_08655 [Novosphingobium lindaniclasticum LE124]|uniref:Uncharacterized protein n=1 Tax=Novosphingobium lindaniclasticum LE124 TaxID=1096930 RepID=T0HL71_9SPHN|nr:hypothetical protein L284_08655 [Novosphingobium lindaniclasticum LE124]